jgi:S-adenosylmethionine:tRNA ribosyltransferase-isomerase
MAAAGVALDFIWPAHIEASEPPEARGLRRDEVRLLVSRVASGEIDHARFSDLPRWLAAGDLVVFNTSATVNAALNVTTESGEGYELHLSTQLPGGFWSVELRKPGPIASLPCRDRRAGTKLSLPGGGAATLLAPYPLVGVLDSPSRLWIAALELPEPALPYLDRHGFPIRYEYVPRAWPPAMYQTIFASEPGSAEMPSAGRPFTPELVTALVSRGVQLAPLVLHTGVASVEEGEPPYEEFYRVSRETAARVTATRRSGHRIIAVGTTVVRALETVTDAAGTTHAGEGWTNLVIRPAAPVRSVDGLITGLHDPRATHLAVLEAVMRAAAGSQTRHGPAARHLARAYAAAATMGYLWHEFGDSHLIIGDEGMGRDAFR